MHFGYFAQIAPAFFSVLHIFLTNILLHFRVTLVIIELKAGATIVLFHFLTSLFFGISPVLSGQQSRGILIYKKPPHEDSHAEVFLISYYLFSWARMMDL
jgi:hypothetical protein